MLKIFDYLCIFAAIIELSFCQDDILHMIKTEKYPAEKHRVITEDQYILGVYRIPSNQKNSKVVFIMHGLLLSSADYLIFGSKYSMGYVMSDAGYDVWLGNTRGTAPSRDHKIFDPNISRAFWNYSFHEIGKYDLPAIIDYILETTNRTSLHYIGHSQGCTTLFVMLSLRPNYNDKIKSMHAMAPAVFMGHSRMIDGLDQSMADQLEMILRVLSNEITTKRHEILVRNIVNLCGDNTVLQIVCASVFMMLTLGPYSPPLTEINSSFLLRNTPASVSMNQMQHFIQIIKSGKYFTFTLAEGLYEIVFLVRTGEFHQFDYKNENFDTYGMNSPPKYNLSNVKTDLQILYGTEDNIVPKVDIDKLIKICGERVVEKILYEQVNHFHFIYADNAKELFYSKIIQLINKY